MAVPLDPYDPLAPYPAWDGAWPPDPSWDDVPPEAMPMIGAPPPAPVAPVAAPSPSALSAADQARAAADALFQPEASAPPVQLGFPRAPAESEGPWDADQIQIEPEEDWTGLADPYAEGQDPGAAPGPADEDLIEIEEPEAPPPTEAERTVRLAELAANDPAVYEQLQRQNTLADLAAEDEAVAARAKAATANREEAEGNERVYKVAAAKTREKSDAVAAEAERLANERVDPDGWRDSRTTFQTIAMYVAGIVGGLVQSRQGGPNQGLAMINNEIERHIAAQQANITNRRAMLGDKRTAVGEEEERNEVDFRTTEAFRQSAWQRVADDIATERMKFDPIGTRARKLADEELAARAQQAAAREAYAEKTFKQQIEIGTQMRAEEKHILDMQKTKAEIAKLGGYGGGGGGGAAAKMKRTAADWNTMYPGANVPDDGTPLTIAEYRQRGETGKSLTAPTEQEKEARNLAVTGPRGQLKQKGGAFYNPPTEAATKTRNIVYTTGQIIADLDRALYLRDSVGGELGQLNSNERQEYDQIEQRVTLMAKGQNEGMSSDSDLKRLGMSLGVENLASFRSKSHGLKTARDAIERQSNGWLIANNYTGDPVTWPNTQTKSTKRTAKEKFAQDLIKSNAGNDPSRVPTAFAATGPLGVTVKAVDWAAGKVAGEIPATADEEKKMRAFIRGAQKGDAASLQALRDIKDGSNSEAFRNQAEAVLAMHEFLRGEPDEDDKDREAGEAFLKEGE